MVRLVVVLPDGKTTVVEGMRVRFESEKGKSIQEGITDQDGSAAIDAMAQRDEGTGRITARPQLSGVIRALTRDLSLTEVVFYYAIEREGYPVQVTVAMEDGSPVPKLEADLTRTLNQLGYVVDAESPILIKGAVIPGEMRSVEGLGGTQTLAQAQLDLSVTDLGSGTILERLTFDGRGMDPSAKRALGRAVQQIKIEKEPLASSLRNARQVFSVFSVSQERKGLKNFEEGRQLYEAGQTESALLRLKNVPVGTTSFRKAQELIGIIREKMPMVPEEHIRPE
ncbi:MAG: hypothetical protein V1800_06330 [Candidatus Latescibacterota bacterium]